MVVDTSLWPKPRETMGQYLRRCRTSRGLTLEEVRDRTAHLPPQQRASPGWLSRAERDQYETLSGDKLRSLAKVYDVPPRVLLEKAGIQIEDGDEQPYPLASDLAAALERNGVKQLALRASELDEEALVAVLDMVDHLRRLQGGD